MVIFYVPFRDGGGGKEQWKVYSSAADLVNTVSSSTITWGQDILSMLLDQVEGSKTQHLRVCVCVEWGLMRCKGFGECLANAGHSETGAPKGCLLVDNWSVVHSTPAGFWESYKECPILQCISYFSRVHIQECVTQSMTPSLFARLASLYPKLRTVTSLQVIHIHWLGNKEFCCQHCCRTGIQASGKSMLGLQYQIEAGGFYSSLNSMSYF